MSAELDLKSLQINLRHTHESIGLSKSVAMKLIQELEETRAKHRKAWGRAEKAESAVARVRGVADGWETGAMRWEDPLPVPKEVSLIRNALGLPTHDPNWEDSMPDESPSCSCGYNGTPKECWQSRRALVGEQS